jgi:Protein of unknown function (DUF2795)
MAKVREKQLRDALVDVDYPVGKQALLEHARRNGADGDVLAVLRALPPVEYGNFAEVLRSVDTEEATGQSAAEKAARARQHDKPIAEHLRATGDTGRGRQRAASSSSSSRPSSAREVIPSLA